MNDGLCLEACAVFNSRRLLGASGSDLSRAGSDGGIEASAGRGASGAGGRAGVAGGAYGGTVGSAGAVAREASSGRAGDAGSSAGGTLASTEGGSGAAGTAGSVVGAAGMLGCLVDGATCDDRDGSKAVEVARHLAKSSRSPRNHNLHAAARSRGRFPDEHGRPAQTCWPS